MKRVLVTGASGFIGRHALAPLIERGFEVYAVRRDGTEPEPAIAGCTWRHADLLDLTAIRPLIQEAQPTHLLHFAWNAVPGQYWTTLDNFAWVQASIELLRRFQEAGGQRVVMAGTCAEYDWAYGYCSEGVTPTAPTTTYGTCKLALQRMLDAYAAQTDLSSAWGRIFFLYGPHEHPARLVSSVARALLQGEPARTSRGTQLRDFLHVQDVADAFVALLDSGVEGPVNIASGRPVTLEEVICKIADLAGRRDLVQLGALSTPPHDPPLLCADIRRLSCDVGWSPQYDLDGGLEQTVRWWRSGLSSDVLIYANGRTDERSGNAR